MIAVSTDSAVMLEGVHVVAEVKVTIDLPGAVYPDLSLALSDLSITASTTTDLPDQARMQVGFPQMTCSFTVKGLVDQTDATKTAAWLFRRYSTDSPLYRLDALMSPVFVDIDLYPPSCGGVPEPVRKFTGLVDSYLELEDGSVQFQCVDKRALFRSLPALPPVITQPPWNAGLTSEFSLDAAARAATNGVYSSWPQQRPQCILAAGMRSSTWPEVGTLVTSSQQPLPGFAPGVFGTALDQASTVAGGLSSLTYQTTTPIGTTVYVEFWTSGVFFPPFIGIHDAAALAAGTPLLACALTNTGPQIIVAPTLGGGNFTWSTTVSAGPHFVAFLINLPAPGGTSWSVGAWLDGVAHTSGPLTFANPRGGTDWNLISAVPSTGTIEALQLTTETSPIPTYPFVPKAVFDTSLNALQIVPAIDAGTDPWTGAFQPIAEAELAVVGLDETGTLRSWNRNTIRSQASVRDVTSSTSLAALQVETLSASVINRAQIGFTRWSFGSPTTVWALGGPWYLPARKKFSRVVTTTSLCLNVDSAPSKLPTSGAVAGNSYYRLAVDKAGTGNHPGVGITMTQISANRVRIDFDNETGQSAWTVASADDTAPPAGTVVLQVGAMPVTPNDEATVDFQYPALEDGGAASSRFGEVAWQVTGNPWIQDADTAELLARDVVFDSYIPRPNLTNISIMPDPRLQLIDVVHIIDPDVTGVDEYARLFGWTLTLSATDWTMSIDARTLAPPGAWILGVAGRSELASTTYLQGV